MPFKDYVIDTQGKLPPEAVTPRLYNMRTGEYEKISFEESDFKDIDGNMEKYKIRIRRKSRFAKSTLQIEDLYVLESAAERILYG